MKPTFWTFILPLLLITSCTHSEIRQFERIAAAEDPSKQLSRLLERKGRQYAGNPQYLLADLQHLQKRIKEFEKTIRVIWGDNDAKIPEKKKYVKYTDQYYSRTQIDLEKGVVIVETLAPDSKKERLHKAIITTLLTPDDPRLVDLYSDDLPEFKGEPFLYQQVLDQDRQPIRYEWRAGRFADYLMKTMSSRPSPPAGTRPSPQSTGSARKRCTTG